MIVETYSEVQLNDASFSKKLKIKQILGILTNLNIYCQGYHRLPDFWTMKDFLVQTF